jgi:hypothetical protein
MIVECLKPTKDDWCGSYKIDGYYSEVKNQMFVQVIFNGNITEDDPTEASVWRTCVWGNDDCGMEFDCATEAECWNKFLQVIGMESVDMAALRLLGFVSA